MSGAVLACQDDGRRERVRLSTLMGLDYLEVSADQLTLTVYMLGQAPAAINPANLQIKGGERITGITVQSVTAAPETDSSDAILTVTVDKYGDFSTYTLCVAGLDGFDPRYSAIDFTFKGGCPSDLDCKSRMVCPPTPPDEPDINYLAKDYASFLQVIMDRMALLVPSWQETHAPDIGIMLAEILAYVGDYLSYYQDAVATEAYLETALQRISVRRHARLVDYHLHEGCNARAWVTVCAGSGSSGPFKPRGFSLSTLLENGAIEYFEPVTLSADEQYYFYPAHNEIEFYTWGDKLCCLPTGATRATLLDGWVAPAPAATAPAPSANAPAPSATAPAPAATTFAPASTETAPPARNLENLAIGDILVFEEVIGPGTGNPADADPSRRWAVRLTQVIATEDPLKNKEGKTTPIVEIAWAAADALPFPLCLSARLPAPDCRIICNISVARGNVILVDNGQTISPPEALGQVGQDESTGTCEGEGSAVDMTLTPSLFRPSLQQSPLTFREALNTSLPASKILAQDPRKAMPEICLTGMTLDASQQETTSQWKPLFDLLESGSLDQNFVVETDNNSVAHLRFGDGELGRMPDAGMVFTAEYRVGCGTAGNVGAETITQISYKDPQPVLGQPVVTAAGLSPRNPFPAQGGTDPEPVTEAQLFAPSAFTKVLERAITAADYATIAERNPKIQNANAELRWTGSWYEAQVAIDPLGTETADALLLEGIDGYLSRFRRVGHDLAVIPAQYAPLDIAMTICVLPQYQRGYVEGALLDVFSNHLLPSGQLGFFAPDNLTFGQGIYLSRLVAAAQAVTGVQSVKVTKLQRLFGAPAGFIDTTALETGVLVLNVSEIAQLDNDPSFPEHGQLKFTLVGGR
jgi:hypothetical protein